MKESTINLIKKHGEALKFIAIAILAIICFAVCFFALPWLFGLSTQITLTLSAGVTLVFAVACVILRNFIIEFVVKYQEIVKYGIFGVLTTLVNYVLYIAFTRGMFMHELWATGTAFVLSIIFAYFTNRIWVFESKAKGKKQISEFCKFFLARTSGLFIDLGIMWLFVTSLGYNDLIVKILSNIFIIVLNFVISKLFVFKK